MDHKKTSTLAALLYFLLFATATNAQTANPYKPQIIPPSPNAASLGKFGDNPVSTYTGTTDISVPVYAVKARGVTVPVGISYHTGGIRLAEESGIVGLGWALNAGGMVSRTVKGRDDFLPGYFNGSMGSLPNFPEVKGKLVPYQVYPPLNYRIGDWSYFWVCNMRVFTDSSSYNLFPVLNYWVPTNSYDLEADDYSFNFLGRSGKFIIGRDGKVVLQKQENLKIEYATDGSSFVITDEQGNKYYFNDIEYSQPATGGAFTNSSWLLSKVITQQKDTVKFNYSTDNTWTTVKGIIHESDRRGVSGQEGTTYNNDPGTTYINKTLQNIDYSNCQVQFFYDGLRSDLLNGKKLNTVKIYSKDGSGFHYLKEQDLYYSYFNPGGDSLEFKRLRLDSIKEVSATTGTSVPPYSFIYNMPANNTNLLGKHYSSVDHWGYWNGYANAVYGDYTKGFTPPFAGIALLGAGTGISSYYKFSGANREPDSACMKAFVLQRVNYPTGGFTTMDYDPNYYDYSKSRGSNDQTDFEYVPYTTVSKEIDVTANDTSGTIDLTGMLLSSYTAPNVSISIGFITPSTDSLTYYRTSLGFGKLNFTFNGNMTDVSNTTGYLSGSPSPGNVYTFVNSVAMAAGTYTWSAHIDPRIKRPQGFSMIRVFVTYDVANYTLTTQQMAGGLRVAAITDYSATGQVAKKRTYDYGYQQIPAGDSVLRPYSYGKVLSYLSYARLENLPVGSTGTGISLTRYSSSHTAFASQSSSNTVGYDQVTEYTVDSANNNTGKTVYTFYNNPDTSFNYAYFRMPGILNLPCALNGLPKTKTVYSRSGSNYTRVSASNYYYRSANRVIYDGLKYFIPPNINAYGVGVDSCSQDVHGNPSPGCACPTLKDSAVYRIYGFFYPAMSSEVVLQDSTAETVFSMTDTTQYLKTTTANFYDNPKHYQVTRTSVTDSKGNKHVTLTKYPQDYIPNGYTATSNTILDTIINKNMVTSPIEKTDSLYYSGSTTGYVTGSVLNLFKILSPNNVAVPDKTYKLMVASPVTDFQPMGVSGNTVTQDSRYAQMVSLDNYDASNNIAQYTASDLIPVAYIWDYNHIYPVAQATNAPQSKTAFTSFEADGSGNWTVGSTARDSTTWAITGKKSYVLSSGGISFAGLSSTDTLVVSYWSTNGSYTVPGSISGKTVTGKTVTINSKSWTYYEHLVTGQTTLTVSTTGSGNIDELRLYPQYAQMTTYTYIPLIGVASQCDINNRVSYYEYDGLGRLKDIKDQDGNILKTYDYHYKQ